MDCRLNEKFNRPKYNYERMPKKKERSQYRRYNDIFNNKGNSNTACLLIRNEESLCLRINKKYKIEKRQYRNKYRLPVFEGKINEHEVKVLRDTGCNCVVTKQEYVYEDQYLNKFGNLTLANGGVISAPYAKVWIDTPFITGYVKALCLKKMACDLLIGNIIEESTIEEKVSENKMQKNDEIKDIEKPKEQRVIRKRNNIKNKNIEEINIEDKEDKVFMKEKQIIEEIKIDKINKETEKADVIQDENCLIKSQLEILESERKNFKNEMINVKSDLKSIKEECEALKVELKESKESMIHERDAILQELEVKLSLEQRECYDLRIKLQELSQTLNESLTAQDNVICQKESFEAQLRLTQEELEAELKIKKKELYEAHLKIKGLSESSQSKSYILESEKRDIRAERKINLMDKEIKNSRIETVEYIKKTGNLKEVLRIKKASRVDREAKVSIYIKEIQKDDQMLKLYCGNVIKNRKEKHQMKYTIKKDLICKNGIIKEEKKYKLLVPKNLRNNLMLKIHDDLMSDHLENEKTFERNDEKASKCSSEEKVFEESSLALDKNSKVEDTDLRGSSLSSSVVKKGTESDFIELKRQKSTLQDIDEKNKRSLENRMEKICLYKLYSMSAYQQKERDTELNIRNLCIKVLQQRKCGLIRFVMGSLIPKQAQFIFNEDAEQINLPKEKLWIKEMAEKESRNNYVYIFELRERTEKNVKLIVENLGRLWIRYKRNQHRKVNKKKFEMEDVIFILLPTSHKKLLKEYIQRKKIMEETRNKIISLLSMEEQQEDGRREQRLMEEYKYEEGVENIKIKEKLLRHQEKDIKKTFIRYKEMSIESSDIIRRI